MYNPRPKPGREQREHHNKTESTMSVRQNSPNDFADPKAF